MGDRSRAPTRVAHVRRGRRRATGVEYAGALSELVRLVLHRDCRDLELSEVRIVLVEGGDRLLPTFRTALGSKAARALEQRHVEVWYGALVGGAGPGVLSLRDGRRLRAGTVVWTAGVRAAALDMDVARVRGGAVNVLSTLQVEGHPEVFVVGDLAAVSGIQLPMLAPVAIQEGEHAGRTIGSLLRDAPPTPFRYRDRGSMATIGRNAAVAARRNGSRRKQRPTSADAASSQPFRRRAAPPGSATMQLEVDKDAERWCGYDAFRPHGVAGDFLPRACVGDRP